MMSLIESLNVYTESQKLVAYLFILVGIALVLSAVPLFFRSHADLLNGYKLGALVLGCLHLAGGLGYLNFSVKTQDTIVQAYEANASQAVAEEKVRMAKVVSDFPNYQRAFAAILLLALGVILFGNDFYRGIAFAVAILFLSNLFVEAHSKSSIVQHHQLVQQL